MFAAKSIQIIDQLIQLCRFFHEREGGIFAAPYLPLHTLLSL